MADLLPGTPDTSAAEETDPRVVGVDSEDADALLSALSSGTARGVLHALHEDPANASTVADRVDTSLQNAQYHLANLQDAGLVEVVDTVYSEKGREMDVYAPADRPLVVFAGDEEQTAGLRAALARLLGGVALLGVASVAVEAAFGSALDGLSTAAGGEGADATALHAAREAAATGPSPGVLFFAGGLAVLVAAFAVRYATSAR